MNEELQKLDQEFQWHNHDGTNSKQIPFSSIIQKKLYVPYNVTGAATSSSAIGVFFIAPFPMTLSGVWESHGTAGTAGGAVTLQIEKLTGTQAAGAGVNMLATAIDLKGAINTVIYYPDTFTTRFLSQDFDATYGTKYVALQGGDRIALKTSGTLTSVADITVLLELTY